MSKEIKNKVTVGKKEISSEEVRQMENFDSIIDAHKKVTKRPAYKQKRVYFFLFLLLVVLLLIYYAEQEEKKKEVLNTEQIN